GSDAPGNRKFHGLPDAPKALSIMGPAGGTADRWMDQCTYWHLAQILQNVPDPPVILVQGRIAQIGPKAIGQLFPAYHLDAPVDLAARAGGTWAIVLRDGSGKVLGRYPFSPVWTPPDIPLVEPMKYFAYKVPDNPKVASIELDGPHGILAKKKF